MVGQRIEHPPLPSSPLRRDLRVLRPAIYRILLPLPSPLSRLLPEPVHKLHRCAGRKGMKRGRGGGGVERKKRGRRDEPPLALGGKLHHREDGCTKNLNERRAYIYPFSSLTKCIEPGAASIPLLSFAPPGSAHIEKQV